MRMIHSEQLALLRNTYTPGTRIELVQMDDIQAPPIGTRGTVIGVDDAGSLLVNWDNGSGLNVIWEVDIVRKEASDEHCKKDGNRIEAHDTPRYMDGRTRRDHF